MKQKAIDCLILAQKDAFAFQRWDEWYEEICGRWSEKAVNRKMEELSKRGYIEYGVSARTGWLTDKGKAALEKWVSIEMSRHS